MFMSPFLEFFILWGPKSLVRWLGAESNPWKENFNPFFSWERSCWVASVAGTTEQGNIRCPIRPLFFIWKDDSASTILRKMNWCLTEQTDSLLDDPYDAKFNPTLIIWKLCSHCTVGSWKYMVDGGIFNAPFFCRIVWREKGNGEQNATNYLYGLSEFFLTGQQLRILAAKALISTFKTRA